MVDNKASKSTVIGTFTGKCCDGNVFNNNDMKLSVELFRKLFASDEYKQAMENRYYIGFLGHPADPNCMDFKDACIVMTNCWLDDNGEVFGTFDLIGTPVGQVVKSFIDAGVTFGISIRGAGDVDAEGNVDPDTFVFRGFDLVTFPAYEDCVPEFQAIAASTDVKKRVKYKKACETVKKNLQSITSATALDEIQSQFKDDSEEYKAVSARIDELNNPEGDDDIAEKVESDKVAGMTKLFLDSVEANKKLEAQVKDLTKQVSDLKMSEYNAKIRANKALKSFKRIYSAQMKDLTQDRDDMERKFSKQIRANKELNSQISDLKSKNLEYVRKIDANSKTISQKDSTISQLEGSLSETVTANTKFKSEASNLDEKVRMLQKRVDAAEQMVLNYQQAYANMYANALGVHIDNIPISASTSVETLQKLISSQASTPIVASTQDFTELEIDTPDDGLVTV